jgi:hypothetical protein
LTYINAAINIEAFIFQITAIDTPFLKIASIFNMVTIISSLHQHLYYWERLMD